MREVAGKAHTQVFWCEQMREWYYRSVTRQIKSLYLPLLILWCLQVIRWTCQMADSYAAVEAAIWEELYRWSLKLGNGRDPFSGGNSLGTPAFRICMCGQCSCWLYKDQKTKLQYRMFGVYFYLIYIKNICFFKNLAAGWHMRKKFKFPASHLFKWVTPLTSCVTLEFCLSEPQFPHLLKGIKAELFRRLDKLIYLKWVGRCLGHSKNSVLFYFPFPCS